MRKSLLFIATILASLTAMAEDIKIGDIKYTVLPDGTLEIKDAKKVSGEYIIASSVTDPKSGKTYDVSSIGTQAFKKSAITSVKIPESIKKIESKAFEECKNLTAVDFPKSMDVIPNGCFLKCSSLASFNLDGKTKIMEIAFNGTALTTLEIPSTVMSIDRWAFGNCSNLTEVIVDPSNQPLELGTAVFYGSPLTHVIIGRNIIDASDKNDAWAKWQICNNNPKLSSVWFSKNVTNQLPPNFLENTPNLKGVVLMDEQAGQQALNVLTQLVEPNILSMAKNYFVKKDHEALYGIVGSTVRPFSDYVNGWYSVRNRDIPVHNVPVYFGARINEKGDYELTSNEPVSTLNAFGIAYKNKRTEDFNLKMDEFIRVAQNDPANLRDVYRKFTPEEVIEFNKPTRWLN